MKFFKAAIQILPFGETKYKRVKKKKKKRKGGRKKFTCIYDLRETM
jgi:hypothetical protein